MLEILIFWSVYSSQILPDPIQKSSLQLLKEKKIKENCSTSNNYIYHFRPINEVLDYWG